MGQFTWLEPLPFCPRCQFDLVFQAQGVHHNNNENLLRMLDNFAAAVACGGWVWLHDSDWRRWGPRVESWAGRLGYAFERSCHMRRSAGYLVTKTCRAAR